MIMNRLEALSFGLLELKPDNFIKSCVILKKKIFFFLTMQTNLGEFLVSIKLFKLL